MSEWLSTYKKTIISALIVMAIVIIGFFLVFSSINGSFSKFIDDLGKILAPIIIGFIIAYLSNPIVSFFEKKIFVWIPKFTIKRLVSIIITLALIIAFIAFVITMLIPSIVSTLESFWDTYIVNYETSISMLANRINGIMDQFPFLDTVQRLNPVGVIEWVKVQMPWIDDVVAGDFSGILPSSPAGSESNAQTGNTQFDFSDLLTSDSLLSIFGYAFSFGSSLFNIIKDLILGIFIAIYMLMAKDRCKAYCRRMLYGFLSPSKARSVIRFGSLLDRSFGGFIEGQLLDAIIVGVVSYIVFSIFGLPIPHLLATIIAVTNVIPVFGPFIGGIPAALLVFLTSPEKTILFVVLIVVIQQIDGNIICPHILGDRINISSLATIIAIVTMGGLYGIFGMLIGVPVFAVIIHLINNYTLNSLRRKKFETSLRYYHVGDVASIGIKEKQDNADIIAFLTKFVRIMTKNKKTVNIKKNKEK